MSLGEEVKQYLGQTDCVVSVLWSMRIGVSFVVVFVVVFVEDQGVWTTEALVFHVVAQWLF